MSISIYDFDTQFAPFEAFAPSGPCAPLALLTWLMAPALWWTDAWFDACSIVSEAAVRAVMFPCVGSPIQNEQHRGRDIT